MESKLFRLNQAQRLVDSWQFESGEIVFTCEVLYIKLHELVQHYCGYCALHRDFLTWQAAAQLEVEIEVHGGLTYCELDDERALWILGFDCAHAGDDENPLTRSLDWLRVQCESMARQIAAYKLAR